MAQLNINMTPDFENNLKIVMKKTGIATKSEAIRQALSRMVEMLEETNKRSDYSSWVGLGLKAPLNQNIKFKSDDDIWE